MIHPSADVQTSNIGEGTTVWQFSVILPNAVIGKECNINCHTFIENEVKLGDRVTIKSGVYLWNGIIVEDDVFIGPNATFVNDKYPRSKQFLQKSEVTRIKRGVSIGAGAVLLSGITIGEYALIAAGAVVTKDIPPYALVKGNPGKVVGSVSKTGEVVERY